MSLGPPVGGVVVFAHECENIVIPSIRATGMAGKNLDIYLLIILIAL